MTKIIGWKGLDKDFKCRDFQFEVGQEYTEKEAVICEKGFHFCENPLDVLRYYRPSDSRFALVEGSGKTAKHDDNSKIACANLKIEAEIGLKGLIEAGMKFVFEKIKWGKEDTSQTHGNSSAAQTHGDSSAAQAHGDSSAAQTHGYSSAAQTHGYYSAAQTHGNSSAAQTHGDSSAAQTHGYYSAAQTHGNSSAAQTHGDSSAAQTHGDSSAAQTHGYSSAAQTHGYSSAASVYGPQSIACSTGIQGKAKGKKTCWLVLAEWQQNKKNNSWVIKSVQSVKVDGIKIREDVFYTLKNGKFVEVE